MGHKQREFLRETTTQWIESIGILNSTYLSVHNDGSTSAYFATFKEMDDAWSKLHMARATVTRTSFKGKLYQYVRFFKPEGNEAQS